MAPPFTEALAAARLAWPEVSLTDAEVGAWLASRGDAAALNVTDLYVACACARGDARAIAAVEARYFGELDRALAQVGVDAARVADVKQILRRDLFVADPPGIAGYSGRGQLRRWLRVVALRAAERLGHGEHRQIPLDDVAALLPATSGDPELAYLQASQREAFTAAFSEAMAALGADARLLLKQHFLDGLGIDQLAALYAVHRATAARRLVAAREAVAAHTREALVRRLGASACDSVLGALGSQLDVSIRRHLAG